MFLIEIWNKKEKEEFIIALNDFRSFWQRRQKLYTHTETTFVTLKYMKKKYSSALARLGEREKMQKHYKYRIKTVKLNQE